MSKRKMIITAVVTIILAIVSAIFGVNYSERDVDEISNSVETVVNTVDNIVDNQSTIEIPEGTIKEEENLEIQEVENESFELQGDIAYEGDAKTWSISTGNTPQLTYISQIDSRWRYYPYSLTGNSSQTIGSSGCGVASAAMIIDSIVGNVSVTELADTFVKNGYRSANSGTYWSAYRAIADEFDIEYTETSNFDTIINLLRNNHYIIASCGNGLFTSNGHYIVLYGIEGNTIKIYDPYLYAGKFDTSTRRGKAIVKGNTVYVTIDNFKNYANYKQFFCYKYNPNTVNTSNSTDTDVSTATYIRYVKVNTSLNVRNSPGGAKVGSLKNGTEVTVYETNGIWARIGESKWVSVAYLSSINPNKKATSTQKAYTTGKYKVSTNIHVRMGAGINYKAKTYKQLTQNARHQNKLCGDYYYNGYRKGVICNIVKVQGNWGLTKSGWICLDYCNKI
nr:MAG TPA: peptidase [Caudoviricetes sp.]